MGGGFKRIFSFQYLIREIKFIFLDMWPKLKFNWISPVDTCYTFDDYGDFSQHENFKKDSISSRQNIPFLMSAKKLSEEILGLVGTCHEWERWVLNWEYFKWKRKIIWKEKKLSHHIMISNTFLSQYHHSSFPVPLILSTSIITCLIKSSTKSLNVIAFQKFF